MAPFEESAAAFAERLAYQLDDGHFSVGNSRFFVAEVSSTGAFVQMDVLPQPSTVHVDVGRLLQRIAMRGDPSVTDRYRPLQIVTDRYRPLQTHRYGRYMRGDPSQRKGLRRTHWPVVNVVRRTSHCPLYVAHERVHVAAISRLPPLLTLARAVRVLQLLD